MRPASTVHIVMSGIIRHRPSVEPRLDEHEKAELMRRVRSQVAAEREAIRPMREKVIATGPELRDPEAAVDCACACHPRPASQGIHGGGVDCPCQQTPEERRADAEKLVAGLRSLLGDHHDQREAEAVAIQEEAARMEVEVSAAGGFAPYQIEGRVDGVRFYLRERHGSYEVRVPDEQSGPDADPSDYTTGIYVIEEGDDRELYGNFECGHPNCEVAGCGYDPAAPLRVAVRAVRRYLRQQQCRHESAGEGDAVCSRCGTELIDAIEWRF